MIAFQVPESHVLCALLCRLPTPSLHTLSLPSLEQVSHMRARYQMLIAGSCSTMSTYYSSSQLVQWTLRKGLSYPLANTVNAIGKRTGQPSGDSGSSRRCYCCGLYAGRQVLAVVQRRQAGWHQ